ncbi:urokinase-type plasminogen activator isoform X2 [Zootoca vivipara]|uniref:urokinase-type plasminogen activator isoform X2 n=1 Tax=Zootoca vivipara TaxID=8524 RepID=UPI00293BD8E1|nr:urokinase-type plasminogen activator isoform X2 [Zootoca vivipara]
MKLVVTISVMLSVLVTDITSFHHWKKDRKLGSKAKYEHKGCTCLNGGTCVSYYLFSGMRHCLCPKGYSGDHCEIDAESRCYTDNGEDYRGTLAVNEKGERCLDWDSPSLQRWPYHDGMENAMKLGLGKHNFCRNPDGRSKPWCYVRKGYRTSSTSCKIDECRKEATCGQRSFRKYFKIVGGYKAPIESQPWIATIYHTDKRGGSQFLCGGSLIDACWVLTAAHCFGSNTPEVSKLNVILGKSELYTDDTKEQKFNVDRVVIHEDYTLQRTDYNNDIALLRIRSSSGQCAQTSDTVKTICLPSQDSFPDNFQCEVSGYGRENKTDIYFARILKSTNVNLIPQSLCKKYYKDRVTGNMFCAGDETWQTDSCKGDSGGPLVCASSDSMVLYGIVSWGDGCADKERPGVYTRVTNYLRWIETHMNGIHFKSSYLPK